MFDNGFMNQSFAFGGEEGKAAFDEQIIYRSSLQNFLIDTDEGVILVDTGFRADFQAPVRKLGAPLYMGELVDDYLSAFTKLGYSPEQVVKIIITHKHNDHTDALSFFPNAAIYIAPEDADAMKLEGDNIVRLTYGDGPYKNFPRAQKVADGLWVVEAKGHTLGNSVAILEHDSLFYMFHGDVTYCDAALKANKLSIVFEDRAAARQTLDRMRQFVIDNPTIYLSTHCPEGYENLEMKRIMKLV